MDCDVCFQPFTIRGSQIPKVLECGHTFCSKCIGFFNNQCATCRRSFSITSTNFLLVQLIDKNQELLKSTPVDKSQQSLKPTNVDENQQSNQ